MLVLSRKRNEQIVIGDDVVLTVVEIRGDKVRLGIDAPKEIPIYRREILLRNLAAGLAPPPSDEVAQRLKLRSEPDGQGKRWVEAG